MLSATVVSRVPATNLSFLTDGATRRGVSLRVHLAESHLVGTQDNSLDRPQSVL